MRHNKQLTHDYLQHLQFCGGRLKQHRYDAGSVVHGLQGPVLEIPCYKIGSAQFQILHGEAWVKVLCVMLLLTSVFLNDLLWRLGRGLANLAVMKVVAVRLNLSEIANHRGTI